MNFGNQIKVNSTLVEMNVPCDRATLETKILQETGNNKIEIEQHVQAIVQKQQEIAQKKREIKQIIKNKNSLNSRSADLCSELNQVCSKYTSCPKKFCG